MNISRNFLLIGVLYILGGMVIGEYMGGSGDISLVPVHAHANLLGFVLPAIFALVYRSWPVMAASKLAPIHFWLHTIGTLVLLTMIFLFFTGRITEAAMVPISPVSGFLIIIGTALFGWNLLQNAK